MTEIRIALVGLGGRGLGWLRLLQRIPGYRITALCDPIAALHERARATLEQPDDVTVTADYEEVLADASVDAVDRGGGAGEARLARGERRERARLREAERDLAAASSLLESAPRTGRRDTRVRSG